MSTSFQVLCPNGRRQTVKVSPSASLLQVIEEVCTKQNLQPSSSYQLRHGTNKILDTSLLVRYCGLANNSKLELIKSDQSRSEGLVTIALQTEQGQRFMEEFKPAVTLWDVLLQFQEKHGVTLTEDNKHPVCVYMREEIIGQRHLQSSTLRSLGLTQGKAIIRFLLKSVSQAVLTKIDADIQNKEKKEQKLKQMQEKQQQAEKLSATNQRAEVNKALYDIEEQASSASQASSSDAVKGAVAETSQETVPMDAETSGGAGSADATDGEKPHKPKKSKSSDRAGGRAVGEEALICSPPMQWSQQGIPWQPSRDIQWQPPQQIPWQLPDVPTSSATMQDNAQPFKFPEETKGKDLYKNEFSDVKREEFKPCDRQTVVFVQKEKDNDASSDAAMDVDNSFFMHTEADLRSRMAELRAQVKQAEESPLMTSAMRQQALENKMDKYKYCVLRIHLPSRHVVQGVFRSRETVYAVQKFVKGHLRDPDTKYYLYTTPPRFVLKDNSQTLFEANLVPLAVIHLGCEKTSDKSACLLSDDALSNISTDKQADDIVSKIMSEHTSQDTGTNKPAVEEKPKTAATNKVPKWLMKGKK